MGLLTRKPPEADLLTQEPELPPAPAAQPCASCGAALEVGQPVCLECGHVVRHRRRLIPSGWPLRAGLASLVALLVSVCAGLGVSAATQGGGKVPKTVAAAPAPTTPAPPATPQSAVPATPAAPAAPAPPAAQTAPAGPAKPATPHVGTPSPHAGGVAPGAPSSSPSSSGGPGPSSGPSTPAQPATGGNAGPFPQGVPFASAYLLNANDSADHPNDTQNAIDGDSSTSWSTAQNPHLPLGIWFDAGSSASYSHFGLKAKGPAYTITIYGSNANNPPQSPPGSGSGWTQLSQPFTVRADKYRIPLSGGIQARYYLVWITGVSGSGPATIVDTALLG